MFKQQQNHRLGTSTKLNWIFSFQVGVSCHEFIILTVDNPNAAAASAIKPPFLELTEVDPMNCSFIN
jgi:hypothetical protein